MKAILVSLVLLLPMLAASAICESGVNGSAANEPVVFRFNNNVFTTNLIIDNDTNLHDSRIVIEIFQFDDYESLVKVPEHHFNLMVECVECGKVIKQRRFATFPIASYGKFEFSLENIDIEAVKIDRHNTLRVTLELIGGPEILKFDINGTIHLYKKSR